MLAGLTERQARLFLMLAALIARYRAEGFQKLQDEDIGQASEALAATFETAAKGIVYEHRTASLPAERLLTELKALVAEVTKGGGSALERDSVIALRKIESAAKAGAKEQPGGNAFQQLLIRVLVPPGAADASPGTEPGVHTPASSIIIP